MIESQKAEIYVQFWTAVFFREINLAGTDHRTHNNQ